MTPMSEDDARYFEALMLGTGPFLGAHFDDDPPAGERGAFWWRKHFQSYAARIEALTAERDAATEREMVWRGKFKEAEVDLSFAIETGERRATAAIVADLRGMEWEKPVPLEIATRLIADHIEQKFGKPAP